MLLKKVFAGSAVSVALAAIGLVIGAGGSSAHDLSLHDVCSTGSQPGCLDVTDTLDPTSPGGTVRYAATGTNHGGSTFNRVELRVTLPAGASFHPQSPPRSSTGTPCSVSGQTAVCAVGTLGAGAEYTAISDVVAPTSGTEICVNHELAFAEGPTDTNPNPGRQDTVSVNECTALEGNPDLAQTFAPAGVQTTCSTGNRTYRTNPQVGTATIPGQGRTFDTTCSSTEQSGVPTGAAALGCKTGNSFVVTIPGSFPGTPLQLEFTWEKPGNAASVCYSSDGTTWVLLPTCASQNPTGLTGHCALKQNRNTWVVFGSTNGYYRR